MIIYANTGFKCRLNKNLKVLSKYFISLRCIHSWVNNLESSTTAEMYGEIYKEGGNRKWQSGIAIRDQSPAILISHNATGCYQVTILKSIGNFTSQALPWTICKKSPYKETRDGNISTLSTFIIWWKVLKSFPLESSKLNILINPKTLTLLL